MTSKNNALLIEKQQLTRTIAENQRAAENVEVDLTDSLRALKDENIMLANENKRLTAVLEMEALKIFPTERDQSREVRVEVTSSKKVNPFDFVEGANLSEIETKGAVGGSSKAEVKYLKKSTATETQSFPEEDKLREEMERLIRTNSQLVEENQSLRRELGRSRERSFSPSITWSIGLQTYEEDLADSRLVICLHLISG